MDRHSTTTASSAAASLVGKFRNSLIRKRHVSATSGRKTSSVSEERGSFNDNIPPGVSPILSAAISSSSTTTTTTTDLPLPDEIPLHPLWGDRSPMTIADRKAPALASTVLHRLVRKPSSALQPRPPPAELCNLVTRLRCALEEFESPLRLLDEELEYLLEENNFSVERARSDFLDRAQLRQVEMGTSLKHVSGDAPGVLNSWSKCDPGVFKVRTGPRYRELKLKCQASCETLYDVVAVDMYMGTSRKEENISRYMKLGHFEHDTSTQGSPLPNLFIANFMLPLTEPKMFSNAENGATVHFHFVMKLSDWALRNPDHHAVRLAARLLAAENFASMKERLKIIVQVANPDELQLGKVERGLCNKYNSLPFLYRAYNSRYHRGHPAYFQADFDGHRSGYATRLARHSLLHMSDSIVANVAFLVEGELDDELPEYLLGCATVHRLQCRNATPFVCPMPRYPLLPREEEDFKDALDG